MLLKNFGYFIQDGMLLFGLKGDQTAFFNGVDLIQNLTLVVCFLVGPFQFVPFLFQRIPKLHFALGNVYVMMTLLLSAPTFIVSSIGKNTILENFYGVILGSIWWWCTRKGIFYISNKKWLLHLKWMMGSFLTLINIVLYKVILYFQFSPIMIIFCAIFSAIAFFLLQKSEFPKRILKSYIKSE